MCNSKIDAITDAAQGGQCRRAATNLLQSHAGVALYSRAVQVMMSRARRRIMLLDSSMIGKRYIDVLCHVDEVTDLLCETPLPPEIQAFVRR